MREVFPKNKIKDKKVTEKERIRYRTDTCEKNGFAHLVKKNRKRYHKSLNKARKGAFIAANTPIYSNSFQYSRVIEACKEIASPINKYIKAL